MGGQVLGGGVIVLVAVLLWLVYLLPSWHSRHQFNAAERNAVRLNQALRILAETSETPDEVRLELNARTALAQQRLAKRATAQREQARLEASRAELERARAERERARALRTAARSLPEARRARARRRVRLSATVVLLAGVVLAGWGGWEVVRTGSQVALWSGVSVTMLCGLMLRRMSRVAARTVVGTASAAEPLARARVTQTLATDLVEDRTWTPRSLPQPLVSAAGSQAAGVLDTVDAQRALHEAARAEALRAEADRRRPPDIAAARAGREESFAGPADDARIEAHVRRLLATRAAG
ncbi:MAG: large exoprotein [Microbacterium sp.]|uniref:large exoprotein n=1 Tax=Microbacterium sp. TaxID=51671 RepID=UPI003A8BCF30